MAKKHWTQTAKGREIMRQNAIRKGQKIKKLKRTQAKEQANGESIASHISYLFGSFSKELDLYAGRSGVSRTALASGVAELLRNS